MNSNRILYRFCNGRKLRLHAPDSSEFERSIAMALRFFVLCLSAYIVFRMLFPFSALGLRLGDLTIGHFLVVMLQAMSASAAAAYFLFKGLRNPPRAQRNRAWCERWSATAFGVLALLIGSVVLGLLERKGIVVPWIRGIAIGFLSLLF